MKQLAKCSKCGEHHLRWDYPAREHKKGSSHKFTRLGDEPKSENQQENLVEAEGLSPEGSK